MGNDLSTSNNELLKMYQQTILQDNWLDTMYSSTRSEQQSELKKIFSIVSQNSVTTSEKAVLESERDELQEKVERLEAKMAVLEEQMSAKQEEIESQAEEITNLVTQAETKSEALAEKQKSVVKTAISDVFAMYERGQIGNDAIVTEIRTRIASSTAKTKGQAEIENILSQLDSKQTEVQSLVDQASTWIDQKNLLANQYGVTKSAYELINTNLEQIGATETNYTNSDYDTATPIYSLSKLAALSGYFEDTNINVASTNTSYDSSTSAPTIDSITEKYQSYFTAESTDGVDAYSTDNEAVTKLSSAIEAGMLEDLASAGLSFDEISDFLTTNFSGAKIKYNSDGNLSIPYGHGSEAKEIYSKVTDFIKNYNTYDTTNVAAENTWDENAGNTISSNAQIASLAANYETILDTLNSQGFTFKETMYALFDSENGLFGNSGITYNCEDQDDTPSYFIQYAGDEETAQLYSDIADKIYELYGVKASRGASYENYGEEESSSDDNEVDQHDPLTFEVNGTTYSMIYDRDGDGVFDGTEEFVGGSDSSTWLDDLKALDTDGDGKLTGDELANLKLLGTDYTDNASVVTNNLAYTPDETESDKTYTRSETTNIQYTLTDAQTLGIEEIDLTGLESQVNQSKGTYDINGSEQFNDTFSFTLNGETVDVTRQDETDYFMNAIYGAATGKNFNIGFSESDVENVISDNYGEYDDFIAQYADTFTDLNVLSNVGSLAEETRNLYEETVDDISQYEKTQLIEAGNKAASYTNVSGWTSIQTEVLQIANDEGISIDLEQAKGIYVLDASLDAQGIVDTYKEQVAQQEELDTAEANKKTAWSAILLCAQNGIAVSSADVLEMLNNGEATSAQEVLEALQADESDTTVDTSVNDLGSISDREDELYEAFHNAFTAAGIHDKTVEALAELCKLQQSDSSYMTDKTAEELAEEFVAKYSS